MDSVDLDAPSGAVGSDATIAIGPKIEDVRVGLDSLLTITMDMGRHDIAECVKMAIVLSYELPVQAYPITAARADRR